ncbi:hypothetical protein [Veillonella ratti]|uniref:hypothetical protein n=1 Tax=Veillonella ratti TaxID=103892 RepID=UPI000F8E0769|nr:hypothetical protein [Veillonella ratti]
MVGLQRALLIIAFLYILYHIYGHGFTTTNLIAIVLLLFSFVFEITRKARREKLEAYFARKEAEIAAKEAAKAAAARGETVDSNTEKTVDVEHKVK